MFWAMAESTENEREKSETFEAAEDEHEEAEATGAAKSEEEEPGASEQTRGRGRRTDRRRRTRSSRHEAFDVVIAVGHRLAGFGRVGRRAEFVGYRVVGIASAAAGA